MDLDKTIFDNIARRDHFLDLASTANGFSLHDVRLEVGTLVGKFPTVGDALDVAIDMVVAEEIPLRLPGGQMLVGRTPAMLRFMAAAIMSQASFLDDKMTGAS
jgi:hypothetical protein